MILFKYRTQRKTYTAVICRQEQTSCAMLLLSNFLTPYLKARISVGLAGRTRTISNWTEQKHACRINRHVYDTIWTVLEKNLCKREIYLSQLSRENWFLGANLETNLYHEMKMLRASISSYKICLPLIVAQ